MEAVPEGRSFNLKLHTLYCATAHSYQTPIRELGLHSLVSANENLTCAQSHTIKCATSCT